jgi:uncharacterized protein YkwD
MRPRVQLKPESLVSDSLVVALVLGCLVACRAPAPVEPTRTVEAPGKGASHYVAAAPSGRASLGPAGAGMARSVSQAARQRGRAIAEDPRLAELARWVVQALARDVAAPPSAVIDLYARHLGLVEPTPHLLIMLQPDAAALEQHLAREVVNLMPNQPYTHYGAYSMAHGDGVLAVVVLSFRQLTLSPVPRAVAPDATLTLQGSLAQGLQNAQLVVTYPDGSSQRSQPQLAPDFKLQLQTRGRGEHRVELLADSSDGIQVLANFPVFAGVPPVRAVTVAADGGELLSAEQLGTRLLERMNAERVRAGRKPLQIDAKLATIALAHTEDMHAHNFIAHTSPTTGSAVDRANRAGVRTPLVLENIGRGYSADEIHRGLMESPGHRENILNRDATHVGMGVIETREDQQAAYLVTEVFARFAAPTDLRRATYELIAAITRAREQRGLKPLQHDAALSERCATAARSLFQGGANKLSKEQLIERLNRDAAASGTPYSQLLAAAVLISSVDEASELEPWFDPSARALAIGLAQGTRSDTFENAIILVALIAY